MKQTEKMKIINPNCAGIDVGSRSHFVAVGQEADQVREFGVYSSGMNQMVIYLKENGITSIAMESTGSYWQSLFRVLQEANFDVILVSGHQTKNLRAKTDVKDCQWIQKLHALGLLKGCFLPSDLTLKLRVITRHKQSLIESSSAFINKMQKAMRLMNLRLDVVISDITGVSGIKIIEAILAGERNGNKLSQLANSRVRKSKEEIADALQGQWSEELLYELRDCYDMYKALQEKVERCDVEIEKILTSMTAGKNVEKKITPTKQRKMRDKNLYNLPQLSYKLFGVDLFAVEGINTSTVASFISEVGSDIFKFATSKHFTSWLRVAPNNRVSGGKILSSRTPKGKNKFTLALRNAANSIDRLKKQGPLTTFFKRVAYKKGRAAAITATARKLATIIWNMVVKKQEYNPMENERYLELIKFKRLAGIKKVMQKYGITTQQLTTS